VAEGDEQRPGRQAPASVALGGHEPPGALGGGHEPVPDGGEVGGGQHVPAGGQEEHGVDVGDGRESPARRRRRWTGRVRTGRWFGGEHPLERRQVGVEGGPGVEDGGQPVTEGWVGDQPQTQPETGGEQHHLSGVA
jgi:hypothetical protein